MQFVVPQFIEVESKVIGPISVRQFIILLVGAGVIYIQFELFTFWVFAVLGVITLAITGIIAFAKVNSQPFHTFALSVIQTLRRPSLAVWRRNPEELHVVTKVSKKDNKKKQPPVQPKDDINPSDIAELSLIADTGGKYTPNDNQPNRV